MTCCFEYMYLVDLLFGRSSSAHTREPEHLVSCKVPGVAELSTNLGKVGKLARGAQARSRSRVSVESSLPRHTVEGRTYTGFWVSLTAAWMNSPFLKSRRAKVEGQRHCQFGTSEMTKCTHPSWLASSHFGDR